MSELSIYYPYLYILEIGTYFIIFYIFLYVIYFVESMKDIRRFLIIL